jgi:GT2 family glycosyltransferase
MKGDIVILNWNGREDTLRCLQSIMPQVERRGDCRVTVVDNASTDHSGDAIARDYSSVRLIRLAANRGFTGGIAAGVGAADAPYLIFLNNDTTVDAGWLDALIESIESAPEDVFAVSGKMLDPSGERVDFIGGVMTFDAHGFQKDFRKRIEEVVEPAAGAELLFACGGNMIVRREQYVALGGFDTDYFAYLEDVDLGWRAWIAGHRILYAPSAVAHHKSAATSDRLGAFERGVLFERNALQTAVKNFDDATFGAAMAPVLLALLHRLHHYVTERNDRAGALTTPPIGSSAPVTRRGFFGSTGSTRAVIDDPLARMQFRALDWFFKNSEAIMAKRAQVQKGRKRSDAEIFERFPLYYVPTYQADDRLFASSFFRALRLDVPSTDRALDDMIKR